jgi:hypothetical protein
MGAFAELPAWSTDALKSATVSLEATASMSSFRQARPGFALRGKCPFGCVSNPGMKAMPSAVETWFGGLENFLTNSPSGRMPATPPGCFALGWARPAHRQTACPRDLSSAAFLEHVGRGATSSGSPSQGAAPARQRQAIGRGDQADQRKGYEGAGCESKRAPPR